MFYYQGIKRLQFFFDSPNKFAVFVCMLLFLVIGVFFSLKNSSKKKIQRISWLLIPLIICLEVFLAMTYSRGAVVAFVVGMLILFIIESPKWSLGFAFLWGIIIMCVPRALGRIIELDINKDLSINHRLLLWKHVCNMIYSHFPAGIVKPLGEIYWGWYQPLEKDQTYITAVNDYLTLGANYGLVCVYGYLFIIFFTIIALIFMKLRFRSSYLSGLLGALVTYVIASIFSTFYTNKVIFLCFCIIVIFSIILFFFKMREKAKYATIYALTCALFLSLTLFFTGAYFYHNHNIKFVYKQLYTKKQKSEFITLQTLNSNPRRIIVYLFDKYETTLEYEGKITLRKLLTPEQYVLGMGVEPNIEGLRASKKLLEYINQYISSELPIFLIGQNCGARFAMIVSPTSNQVKGIATIGAYSEWPFKELSPADKIAKINIPVLIMHGENDIKSPVTEAFILNEIFERNNKASSLRIVKNVSNYLGNQRGNLLSYAALFFEDISGQDKNLYNHHQYSKFLEKTRSWKGLINQKSSTNENIP